jgi:hypothetical protein
MLKGVGDGTSNCIGLSPMQIRVPVQNPDGRPAMPTKPSRPRRWVQESKATAHWNDLGQYSVRLVVEPSGRKTQKIVIGIDPGKKFSGIAVQSAKATLFTAHLILPFPKVIKKMSARRILRRARRGRRINHKLAYKLRSHRQKRFNNRRQKKLAPSIRANRELELRVVKESLKVFPVSTIVYEYIEAKGNKAFSPIMVGQKWMIERLSEPTLVVTQFGWQTANTRKYLGLEKNKVDKAEQSHQTHAVDGIALAETQFISYQSFHQQGINGHERMGSFEITPALFCVVSRPSLYRLQLHFENPIAGGRKRKRGTITPFGFRSGDLVFAQKSGQNYKGWVGGYTLSGKTKNVSVYDHNWKRIGQFVPNRVQLIKRSTKLCVAIG